MKKMMEIINSEREIREDLWKLNKELEEQSNKYNEEYEKVKGNFNEMHGMTYLAKIEVINKVRGKLVDILMKNA